ncbi:hypothetical protein BT63DRAFT_442198 [Microthyrium microscopicum]|uniref:DUF862-domain-containing protein n=1 Tax=Microthyrium microscopicum TaxID=703497 RepID=A0A6A6U8K6_9PEZI|nr:hypothetical protein BT63DRAFT_442198 [Microthyrium microscopicum]
MAELDNVEDQAPEAQQSKRDRMGTFLKQGLLKGKLQLEHGLGLGHRPNVIPPDHSNISGDPRLVEIGWHPVGGFAGKWFAEKTGVGKMITEKINKYPDPTQHWAVLVGDYCHELWMDEHLDVIYINEKINKADWHTFEVGHTRFNDEALRHAGEMTIHKMREKRPGYNLISNNCQNFATVFLEAIKVGAHREFATSFAVYQRTIGKGAVADLFADKSEATGQEDIDNQLNIADKLDEQAHANDELPGLHRQDTVQNAQHIMDENTTKLDSHDSLH